VREYANFAVGIVEYSLGFAILSIQVLLRSLRGEAE
jgi:hypothetical protein